jgi:K+:H+ antiporter
VAIPNVFETGQVIKKARAVNPAIRAAARAENEVELAHLLELGADEVVIGRREIALGMLAQAFGARWREGAATLAR